MQRLAEVVSSVTGGLFNLRTRTPVLLFRYSPHAIGRGAMPKKLEKRAAQPRISIAKPGREHNLGLWIDYDLLRKHQNHTPTILHDASPAMNNRYLALADLALGNKKTRKKSKAAAAAAEK